MSDGKVLCDSYPRNGSINNLNNNNNNNSNNNSSIGSSNNSTNSGNVVDNGDNSSGGRRTASPIDSQDGASKPRSISDSHDLDRRSPREHHDLRRNSAHGLDLSKPPPSQQPPPSSGKSDDSNGLDLSKPEMINSSPYSRSSDPSPFTNGIPSDTPPTPGSGSYGPTRSHSAGEAVSPFRADSVPNGYSPDNLSNGQAYKSKFSDSFGKPLDSASKFQDGFNSKVGDAATTSPGLSPSASSPTYSSKISDSYIASKLSENSFPKPQDAYSKILEDFGNVRNNNNNIPGAKLGDEFPVTGKHSDSPYGKISESLSKQNGYKSDPSIFKQENSLSPGAFQNELPSLGSFPKSEPSLTNGTGYGSKTEAVSSSSSQLSNQLLPSIVNFSANHLRGISAPESGLASYLNSFGVGGAGSGGGERVERGGGGSGGGGGGGGDRGGEGNLSRASPNNKLACRFCGKTFSQAGYIKAHERLHTGEKPFACSVCGKRFSDPSNWKKHERVHANNKKPSHLLETHESKVKNLFMKSMSSLVTSSLQQRLALRPDPSGPIMCKICGKMFSSQSSLSTHKRIHTGERPYRCSSCGKCFTQIGTLRTHERIHTGEKPYICKVCGRTFAQSGSYRMHERRHMTDSIQRCHICYATFSTWQDLQRHMASHPQVTQAILEFEDGNQGLIDRLNSGDLGGQLGDSSIGQLGHPDGEPQGHGHSLLQGLYHSPGQLPPFSSILPFRHHPGGPPAFPPSFPPGLSLLGTQSLPVTSHADLLSKHTFFGAMLGATQLKHDLSKLSPTYSSQQHQHLHHQQQQHQHHLEQHQQQQHPEHSGNDGTDVVSTTSASKRADADLHPSSRSYSPEERSDTETMTNLKDDKDGSALARSVSSDEGLHSPDDHHMETNGEEDLNQDQEMADNENDDDTDLDERDYPSHRRYNRSFSQSEERGMGGDRERDRGRDRERGGFGGRKRSRSFDNSSEKERRDFKKERNPSGGSGSGSKSNNGNRETDYHDQDRDRDYDRNYDGSSRSNRNSISNNNNSSSRHDQSSDHAVSKDKDDNGSNTSHNNNNTTTNNNNDNMDLRPPRRHIERQNLNTRMIPSSSSRKQRHPMRRFSSAGSEQESPQSTSSLPVSSTTVEAIERGDLTDNDLVTFLLTKGRVHKCIHCHMIFEDASLFLLHNGFHAHDEPFRCVVCSTVCKDRIDFNCHLTSHIK